MSTATMTTAAKDIEIFSDHCVFMRSVYLHARTLFETSTTDEKALMARAANTFFGDLSMVLTEHLILQVCKITDPARDFKKNENHTLALMLERFDFSSDPQISAQLGRLHDNIQAFSNKLRPARNKLISHSDKLSILASQPLGAATPQECGSVLARPTGRTLHPSTKNSRRATVLFEWRCHADRCRRIVEGASARSLFRSALT